MIPLTPRLLDYLETVSRERPHLVPEKAAGLPLFRRERYQIQSLHLFGRRFLLAMETNDWDAG